jgi:hypothetical protein
LPGSACVCRCCVVHSSFRLALFSGIRPRYSKSSREVEPGLRPCPTCRTCDPTPKHGALPQKLAEASPRSASWRTPQRNAQMAALTGQLARRRPSAPPATLNRPT